MFFPDMQGLLKPMYDLIKKNFLMDLITTKAFDEIKKRLLKQPTLHLTHNTYRFQLF